MSRTTLPILLALALLGSAQGSVAQDAASKPAVPQNFSVTVKSDTELTLGWESVEGLSYEVERSESEETGFKSIALTAPGDDSKLSAGTQYFYRLFAKRDGTKSDAAAANGTTKEAAAPVVASRTVEVTEDVLKKFSLDVTYSGNKDDLQYKLVKDKGPKNGTVSDEGKPAEVSYDPKTNFFGTDEFTVTVADTKTKKVSEPVTIKVTVTAAPTSIAQQVASIKAGEAGRFSADKISTKTECKLVLEDKVDGKERVKHVCDPGAITVSATDTSTVVVELPKGVKKVRATANVDWARLRPGKPLRSQFPKSVETEFDGDVKEGSILIGLYQWRALNRAHPKSLPFAHKDTKGKSQEQLQAKLKKLQELETPGPKGERDPDLQLVLPGKNAPEVLKIDISGTNEQGPYAYSLEIELLYFNWFLDAAGFYGLRLGGDEELITQAAEGEGKTTVLQVREPSASSISGVMMHFFKSSYPKWGLALGLDFPTNRSPTFYLGGGRRFLHRRKSAVLTISAGVAATQLKTFPGVVTDMAMDADSPLLKGEIDYDVEPFLTFTLGFQLPNKPSAPN